MIRCVVHAWLLLLHFDWLMRSRGFEAMYETVRRETLNARNRPKVDDALLSSAIDTACVLYFKPVLCLQRSAALAVLLRRYGLYGELVIGVQPLPFQSHAWVEMDGRIVNDKPTVKRFFQVLDRC